MGSLLAGLANQTLCASFRFEPLVLFAERAYPVIYSLNGERYGKGGVAVEGFQG